jgi:signal transduction histidine kinase
VLAPFRSRGFIPYAVGLFGVAVASLLRNALDPVLGEHLSFSFYYLAVSLAAWTGGIGPAIFTAIISAIVGDFFFSDPYLSLEISGNDELINLLFFVFVSGVIGVLSEISLRALARAKKAEEEKDNFMATVAHELRSPLSAIYYATSLTRIETAELPSSHLDVIDRQVNHLNLMIEDLLDVSRVARGKIRLNHEHVDASTVIHGAVEKSRSLIAGHKHSLKLDISRMPLPLFVDPVRIEQVLSNLLTNAAKYTPDGGQIVVRARPDGESAVVSVRDNGLGIGAEMLPRVFDLFVQADNGRGRDEGGLGIGLALARKVTEMHGGTLRAESAGEGCGSEFIITLPLEQPVAVA